MRIVVACLVFPFLLASSQTSEMLRAVCFSQCSSANQGLITGNICVPLARNISLLS